MPLTKAQVTKIYNSAGQLLRKMETEEVKTIEKASTVVNTHNETLKDLSESVKVFQQQLLKINENGQVDQILVSKAVNELRSELGSAMAATEKSQNSLFQAINEFKTVLSGQGNKELLEALKDLKNVQAPKVEFPESISIDNFPPQKIPQPVTKMALRGADPDVQVDVTEQENSNGLNVAIIDANGDQITSFGGGTQYTEGDVDTSITGTAMMWEDTGDTMRVVSAAKPLPVSATIDTTGLATSANQTTIIGHLDGVEGLLTTIDGDTGNISTKIDTLAGAVSGNEMQVDVLTMPTVTVNAHAVTNAGVFVVQENGAALTALQLIDDPIATLGTTTYTETTTKGVTIGAVRRDADTTLVDTTNEIGPLQMNAAGQLKVEVFSGEALPVTMTSTTVTGNVAVTNAGLTELAAAINASSQMDVNIAASGATVPVSNAGLTALNGAISGTEVQVDLASAIPAGTNAIGKLAANSGVDIGDVDVTSITGVTMSNAGMQITGDEAHDAVDAGNPVKIGFKVEANPLTGSRVADGDRTDAVADTDGMQYVKLYTSFGDILSERVSNTDGSSTAFSTFGATADARNYITTIVVYNSSSTAGYVDFRDGTAGSVIFTAPLPATSGSVISLPIPLRQPTANTALAFDVSGALTTVYISLVGFQSKV